MPRLPCYFPSFDTLREQSRSARGEVHRLGDITSHYPQNQTGSAFLRLSSTEPTAGVIIGYIGLLDGVSIFITILGLAASQP
jgi:hypothetical protein